jgi:hypothetical protein
MVTQSNLLYDGTFMHHSFTPLARLAAPLAFVAMAACGSDSSTGTTGGLSASQKTVLIQTLSRPDIMEAIRNTGDPFVSYGVTEGATTGLSSVGSISFDATPSDNRLVPTGKLILSPSAATITGPTGSYKAFGAQLVITDSVSTVEVNHAVWTGLVAIDNLDSPTTLVIAGVYSIDATAAASVPSTPFGGIQEDSRYASAAYIKITGANTSTVYNTVDETGSVGSMDVTSTSFSGNNGCGAGLPAFIPVCSYSTGHIVGSFGFTAKEMDGTDTVTIPTTSFDIPATRTTIVFDESQFAI